MEFSKYHGLGNDFILINGLNATLKISSAVRKQMCDRKYGIGADGIILLRSTNDETQFSIDYYNADGNLSSLCGNGSRCALAFARRLGIFQDSACQFRASDGIHTGRFFPMDDTFGVSFMDKKFSDITRFDEHNFFIDTGSPHHVRFVPDLRNYAVIAEGRKLRYGRYDQQNGANVNFVQLDADENISVRTYERGVEDETNACGTGAVAVALSSHLLLESKNSSLIGCSCINSVNIAMGNGSLVVNYSVKDSCFVDIELIGEATHVFDGKYILESA